MKSLIPIILIIIVLGVAFLVFRGKKTNTTHSSVINSDASGQTLVPTTVESTSDESRERAIEIARMELKARERRGVSYDLVSVGQFTDNKNRWQIVFDTNEITDSAITIVVETENGKVISYDQHKE